MSTSRKFKRHQPMYEIGTIRQLLAQDFTKRMEKIINDQKKYDQYYILVYADMDATTGKIWTKFMVMNYLPPKMIGTMLYSVDNKLGELRKIWNLPRDIPRTEEHISYEDGLAEMDIINKSAKDMPIIY